MNAKGVIRLWSAALKTGEEINLASGDKLQFLPDTNDQGSFEIGDGSKDMDVKIFLGSTGEFVLFDVGNSRVDFCADGTGVDVRFFGDTSGSDMIWDQSADQLVFDGADIQLGDNDELRLGDLSGGDVAVFWDGTNLIGGSGGNLWANAPNPLQNDPSVASWYYDDFHRLDTSANYQETSDGTPGFAVTDSDVLSGGWLEIKTQPSTPLNNNEVYVSTVKQTWVFLDGKKLWFEVGINLAEANVDDANIIVGLSDTVGANFLVDDGAGPATSYDGAVLFKVDGGTVWQVQTSSGASQATDNSAGSFTSGANQVLGFYFDGTTTTSTIEFFVNGTTQGAQNITLSGLEAMHIVFGVKCGADTQIETLNVDYVKVCQLR